MNFDEFALMSLTKSVKAALGCHSNKDMDVVRHGIYLDYLLFFVCDDARDIPMEFGFVFFGDKGLPTFDSENNMYVDLGVGVGHRFYRDLS